MDLLSPEEALRTFDSQLEDRKKEAVKNAQSYLQALACLGEKLLEEFAQFPNPKQAWEIWKKHYLAGSRDEMLEETAKIKDKNRLLTMQWAMVDSISIKSGEADPTLTNLCMLDAKATILQHVEDHLLGEELPLYASNPSPQALDQWSSRVTSAQEKTIAHVREEILHPPKPLPIPEKPTVPNLRFGIEIEGFLLSTSHWKEQKAFLEEKLGALPEFEGWKIERDWSIKTPTITNYKDQIGIEIISPILTGTKGYLQAQKVMEALQALPFHTNRTCGLHVHVEIGRDLPTMKALLLAFLQKEESFDQLCPQHRHSNPTCGSNSDILLKKWPDMDIESIIQSCSSPEELLKKTQKDKHCKLNLKNACTPGDPPTAEFRMFGAAISPQALTPVQTALDFTSKVLQKIQEKPEPELEMA